jgi:hypothetical protein
MPGDAHSRELSLTNIRSILIPQSKRAESCGEGKFEKTPSVLHRLKQTNSLFAPIFKACGKSAESCGEGKFEKTRLCSIDSSKQTAYLHNNRLATIPLLLY